MTIDELDDQVAAVEDAAGVSEQREQDAAAASAAAETTRRDALLSEITAAENELRDAGWASFDVTPRRLGSRQKHAGTPDLAKATNAGLVAYRDRLLEHQADFDAALKVPRDGMTDLVSDDHESTSMEGTGDGE